MESPIEKKLDGSLNLGKLMKSNQNQDFITVEYWDLMEMENKYLMAE